MRPVFFKKPSMHPKGWNFNRSVVRPNSRSAELQQVGVRISEKQTRAASIPLNFRFKCNFALTQPYSPSLERVSGNGKGEVPRAACFMRRDDASGYDHRFVRSAMGEEQQHIRTNPQCAEALVADHDLKTEQRLIEFARTKDLRDVDAGFDDSMHLQMGVRERFDHFPSLAVCRRWTTVTIARHHRA